LAYAERAVRTVAEKSRSMLLGAPHLPKFMWGLSDTYAVFVIDVLPQPERGNKSPYFYRHNKEPNVDHLHIKVFGCPCQFAPIDGPEHKRASKTEWGYFVGMQWPMCLVYQPHTDQVISVSRKKIVCHEGMYADFDSKITKLPTATIQTMDPSKTMEEIKQSVDDKSSQVKGADHDDRIEAVHSIKVLRDHKRNESINEALPSYQSRNLGEESRLDEDSLLAKIQEVKQQAEDNAESQYLKIVEAIKNVRDEKLKLGFQTGEEYGADISAKNILKERRDSKMAKRKATIQIGNKVKIKTIQFGKAYAVGRPEYTEGKVVSIKGKKAGVVYEGGKEIYDTYLSRLEKITDDEEPKDDNVVATISYNGKWYKKSQTFYTIMATLEVGSA
jgi:hypothetical protein